MKYILLNLLFISILNAQQITISQLTVLDNQVKETSGLIYFNGRLITINDSGNPPFLYEIDTLTGAISRTIIVDNATNVDWESLAQDSLYIYIADFGNNSGERTDLKIYRILKSDYLQNNNVNADTINFSYNNQTDFTSNYRNTEFDAEALSVYHDSLIIFMKDWVNNYTRSYILPKLPGNYIAYEKNIYNCNGLITGSDFDNADTSFMLCGYTESLAPFIMYLNNFSDTNVFDGNITKIDLTDSIGASQTEGICYFNNNRLFLSREEFIYQNIDIEPALFTFVYSSNFSNISKFKNMHFRLFPNPASSYITITGISSNEKIQIIDETGKCVLTKKILSPQNTIDISNLKKGIYVVNILSNSFLIHSKFIKR